MLGAIAGDIIGSVHEYSGTKTTDFDLFASGCQFTDDTVLAVAVADCLLNQSGYVEAFHRYSKAYPRAGYGSRFSQWIAEGDRKPYNSWGNGSAMRVAPVGHAFATLSEVQEEAKRSAEVTHNHPEGIRGAQAVATAIFLARHEYSKAQIRALIENSFEYDLGQSLDDIRPMFCERYGVPIQETES